MAEAPRYPKRLIEVDLPVRQISEEGAREKGTRTGSISTLHLWWARRPLAACRSVTLASLLPDPADPDCPATFRRRAADVLSSVRDTLGGRPRDLLDSLGLRAALLDFIRLSSNHENGRNEIVLRAARDLVIGAHRALRGEESPRPVVADPFAGGGSFPFEALRLGADAFASDLNPVAATLNRVLLEAGPRYGNDLRAAVREAGEIVRREAFATLDDFYPRRRGGRRPVAYLWFRWVLCEGPACGIRLPLFRSPWLLKRGKRRVGLEAVPDGPTLTFRIQEGFSDAAQAGTVRQGHALCPRCGFTTRKDRVRTQLAERRGGTADAVLVAIAETTEGEQGRTFRVPDELDLQAFNAAAVELTRLIGAHKGPISLLPDERIPNERVWKNNPIRVHLYGMSRWSDLYAPRQALALVTLCREIRRVTELFRERTRDPGLADAVGACLALALDREADHLNSLCRWNPTEPKLQALFGRQAIPFVWDFAEADPFGESVGDWAHCVDTVASALETTKLAPRPGTVRVCSATDHPLPDDSVDALITDPPYYDAVPYATLSDFFYVWLKRSLPPSYLADFATELSPKERECVVDDAKGKDAAFFERTMREAMVEALRITRPDGIAVLVFAHKTTAGWESLLQAVLAAGWTVTASWPIGTEMATRLRARDSAALGSSIHLILRPRERPDGATQTDTVGSWRDVVDELPGRLRAWMPRLASEGIVGADAIFACLGPSLEIFSRYARVEKASGDQVALAEYLETVWAAVSREALSMIFAGAETAGLESDGRLTAMWLWTLARSIPEPRLDAEVDGSEMDDEPADDPGKPQGFLLEYDAARKIAQGLGARLEQLEHVVQVKGDVARLLSVSERTAYLFGKPEGAATARIGRKKQPALFGEPADESKPQRRDQVGLPTAGATTLDRVHQAMLLFASGRSQALKTFLSEHGVGRQAQFWGFAQSLSALYPIGTDEKRWVDGVLARKKGLGF